MESILGANLHNNSHSYSVRIMESNASHSPMINDKSMQEDPDVSMSDLNDHLNQDDIMNISTEIQDNPINDVMLNDISTNDIPLTSDIPLENENSSNQIPLAASYEFVDNTMQSREYIDPQEIPIRTNWNSNNVQFGAEEDSVPTNTISRTKKNSLNKKKFEKQTKITKQMNKNKPIKQTNNQIMNDLSSPKKVLNVDDMVAKSSLATDLPMNNEGGEQVEVPLQDSMSQFQLMLERALREDPTSLPQNDETKSSSDSMQDVTEGSSLNSNLKSSNITVRREAVQQLKEQTENGMLLELNGMYNNNYLILFYISNSLFQ